MVKYRKLAKIKTIFVYRQKSENALNIRNLCNFIRNIMLCDFYLNQQDHLKIFKLIIPNTLHESNYWKYLLNYISDKQINLYHN